MEVIYNPKKVDDIGCGSIRSCHGKCSTII